MGLFEKAQLQLQRNAEVARKRYQPSSRRYLLRPLVKCGECGLGMSAAHQRSVCKKSEYRYDEGKGHAPLTCGRSTKGAARRVRADRRAAIVRSSLCELLQTPARLPHLRQSWAQTKHGLTAFSAQQEQLPQRKRRVERQSERSLDADQTEIVTLSELQQRCQELATESQYLDRALQPLSHSQQQTHHWHDVIAYVDHFRHR